MDIEMAMFIQLMLFMDSRSQQPGKQKWGDTTAHIIASIVITACNRGSILFRRNRGSLYVAFILFYLNFIQKFQKYVSPLLRPRHIVTDVFKCNHKPKTCICKRQVLHC